MTTISHVRACQPNTMVDYSAALQASNSKFTDQVRKMDRAVDTSMNKWKGDAAAAASARGLSESMASSRIDTAVVALAEAHALHGAALVSSRDALLMIVDKEAPGAGMTVADDGAVTAPTVPGSDGNVLAMMQSRLNAQAEGFATRIKALLIQFGDGETEAAQAIQAAQSQLETLEENPGAATLGAAVQDIISGKAAIPNDPKQLHDMWTKLSPAEKDALYDHDNYVGNRDGLPVTDRDHYNRIKLGDELARAQSGDPAVSGRLEDLTAVQNTLQKDPNRMLMLLDSQSGEQTHAAVAVGNPDTADHVSVTTPGLNTTVGSSLEGMVDEAGQMKNTAELQLNNTDDHKGERVSTVSWIGYDAPQLDRNDVTSADSIEGAIKVAEPWNGEAAAPNLAQFYEGVVASHDGGDPHLTAVGHSYGSFTTGLALQQTPAGVVDDVVVYGSPGVGTGHDLIDNGFDKLNIEPGHAYEMTAHGDPVAHMNRFGWSPGYMSGFEHLGTESATTADRVHREGATGHSEYPRSGDNGALRTPGYNTAVVIAGLGDVENALVKGDPAIQTGGLDLLEGLAGLGR